MSMAHTVVIADDHKMIVRGIEDLVRSSHEFAVVDTVYDGAAALESICRNRPTIALIDVEMPELSGIQLLQILAERNLETRAVLLTAHLSGDDLVTAIAAGVSGIVLKGDAPDTLLNCLRAVIIGNRWLPDELVTSATVRQKDRPAREPRGWSDVLTSREQDVVSLAISGASNKSIGLALSISEGTVKQHLNNIFRKLDVVNRTEMTARALSSAPTPRSPTAKR